MNGREPVNEFYDSDDDNYSRSSDSDSVQSFHTDDLPTTPPALPVPTNEQLKNMMRESHLRQQAEEMAYRAVIQKYYLKLHSLGKWERTLDIYKLESELTDEAKKDTKTVWITINPTADIKLDDFTKLVEKYVKRKWVTSAYAYTFEQRGETPDKMGTGIHCHLVIEDRGSKAPSEIQRETKKHFIKVCDVTNYHCLNVQFISHAHFNDKIDYLRGIKWDAEKTPKLVIDKQWRAQNGLNEIYFDRITLV